MTKRPTFKDFRGTGSLADFTSLTDEEFLEILTPFRKARKKYDKEFKFDGEKRERKAPKKKRKNGAFNASEDLLLFILTYLKLYPIQAVFAFTYKMKQSKIGGWINYSCNVLLATLEMQNYAPARCVEKLKTLLQGHEKVYLDATEREISRPTEHQRQREFYSGKKKNIPLRMSC